MMMMHDDDEGVWIGHTFTRGKHGGGVIGTDEIDDHCLHFETRG